MMTATFIINYCSYKVGQIVEVPVVDYEALLMAGVIEK